MDIITSVHPPKVRQIFDNWTGSFQWGRRVRRGILKNPYITRIEGYVVILDWFCVSSAGAQSVPTYGQVQLYSSAQVRQYSSTFPPRYDRGDVLFGIFGDYYTYLHAYLIKISMENPMSFYMGTYYKLIPGYVDYLHILSSALKFVNLGVNFLLYTTERVLYSDFSGIITRMLPRALLKILWKPLSLFTRGRSGIEVRNMLVAYTFCHPPKSRQEIRDFERVSYTTWGTRYERGIIAGMYAISSVGRYLRWVYPNSYIASNKKTYLDDLFRELNVSSAPKFVNMRRSFRPLIPNVR